MSVQDHVRCPGERGRKVREAPLGELPEDSKEMFAYHVVSAAVGARACPPLDVDDIVEVPLLSKLLQEHLICLQSFLPRNVESLPGDLLVSDGLVKLLAQGG